VIFPHDMLCKALYAHHRMAGTKPPRRGTRQWAYQTAAIASVLTSIEGDLRILFLEEAVQKARPFELRINGGRG